MDALMALGGTLDKVRANPVAEYIAALDASDATKRTYSRALEAWRRFIDAQGVGVLGATHATVLAYKEELTAERKAATVNAYLTALRGFYGWLESRGVYPNIAADVKNLRKSKAASKDALTVDQARTMLGADADTLEAKRNKAIVCLMIRRGLRCIEVARADVGDIRQTGGEAVLWVQGKGHADKDCFVVLNETCLTPIYEYLDARRGAGEEIGPGSPLFAGIGNRNHGGRMTSRSVSRIASRALEAAGVKSARLTAHSLRHTAVTLALLGGAELTDVQAMARHESIETTMIYNHALDRMKDSRAENAVDAALL